MQISNSSYRSSSRYNQHAMPPKTKKQSTVNGTARERIMLKRSSRSVSSLSVLSMSLSEDGDVAHKDGRQDKKSKLFQQAAMTGDEETVKTFMFKGIDLSITDQFGRTPLHNAILGQHNLVVELLLSGGADVRVKDERGDTPLHTAVRIGDEKILQLLLQNSECEVNATGGANVTPLHLAAGMDRVNVCKMLIEHAAMIDSRDEDQMTPMGHAAERGAKDVVEYFFEYASSQKFDMGSLLYKADLDESSLLHLAVDSGVLKIVDLCLQHGSRVRSPKASDKTTAFHLACEQGSLEMVKLLASHDPTICRITLIDSEGQTPLHRAATKNKVAVIEYLLDQGASVDPPDKTRCTPLFQAAANGGVETVQLLLERGADVTVKSVEQRSVLHAAIRHTEVMQLLLKVPSSAYLITDKDQVNSFTPVHYAAMSGQAKNVALLMATNKAAAGVTSNDMDTPLHIAAKYGWLSIVESLLVGRNVRMINLQNNMGMTPLHLACSNGHDQVVEHLLSEGATIEKDQHQKTPLHLAASRGSKRCAMSILVKLPDCLNALDENKDSALNLASLEGHHEIVIYLLSLKEQKILMNSYNNNLLDIAIINEKRNVAMAIAEHTRWREVLSSSSRGPLLMMQALVIKMPEVAKGRFDFRRSLVSGLPSSRRTAGHRILDQCVTTEGDQNKLEYKVQRDLTIIQAKYAPNPQIDQLAVLKTMTKYRRDKCLTHEVVFSLMHLKWKKFGFTSLIFNLILYLTYLIPLTALSLYSRENEKKFCATNDTVPRRDYLEDFPRTRSNMTTQVLTYIVLVFAVVHLLQEVAQIVQKGTSYLKEPSNYFELTGYISTMMYILPAYDCKTGWQLQVGAIAMFFGWMNVTLYLRKISFYGSYVIMLATMSITLIKVLVLFMLFILAFATTFYLLIDEHEMFVSLPHWLITTFVMTLGEMNYSENFMPWELFPFSNLANVLFVIFVFVMPIILMNMLVGLAVGDIDNIQRHARMDRYVAQIEMLFDTEQQLPRWLRKHVQFEEHIEYPNKLAPLKTRLYDAICGFVHPGEDDKAEGNQDAQFPEVAEVKKRLEEQEGKINEICNMLRKQSEIMDNMSLNFKREKEENEDQEKGERKLFSLMAF